MSTRRSNLFNKFQSTRLQGGFVWGLLILGALVAFEIFNYSTTDFAMRDLLGDLQFAGLRWSTILALAFCGIDFAGIARLFTPEEGKGEPMEVWYLFGAWLLAASMNALLTWWGVSIAILSNQSLGNAVIPRETMLKGVPIFVALMVWLIRILIIGTFSVAGENIFRQNSAQPQSNRRSQRSTQAGNQARAFNNFQQKPVSRNASSWNSSKQQPSFRASSKSRPEPTYHPISTEKNSNGYGDPRN